jgi:hypothetical protein
MEVNSLGPAFFFPFDHLGVNLLSYFTLDFTCHSNVDTAQ